jgi:hypothetical protein
VTDLLQVTDTNHIIGCSGVTNSSNLLTICYMNQIITMMAQMAIEPKTFSISVSSFTVELPPDVLLGGPGVEA